MQTPTHSLRLYWFPISGHAHRAELMLSLLGLTFEKVVVNLAEREQKQPDFLAKNVFGQVPVLEDGVRVWRDMEEVDTSGKGAHPNWPDRFFAQVVDGFLEQTHNIGGRVGSAPSYLFSARALHQYALPVMHDVARAPIGY